MTPIWAKLLISPVWNVGGGGGGGGVYGGCHTDFFKLTIIWEKHVTMPTKHNVIWPFSEVFHSILSLHLNFFSSKETSPKTERSHSQIDYGTENITTTVWG